GTKNAGVPRAGMREWAALVILTIGVTLLSIDNTVLALAMPALEKALHPTSTQILWIADIYGFFLASFLVVGGNLADQYGRKRVLITGFAVFGVLSAAIAWSTSPVALIALRAILGFSAALIMPATLALVRTIFAEGTQRTLAIAIWSAGSTGGMALGPALGGFLLERAWWGSVFLINVPIMCVVIIAAVFLLPESRSSERGGIDIVSACMSVAALLGFVFAVKDFAKYGFSLHTTAIVVVSIAVFIVFLRRQKAIERPILDLELFKSSSFNWALFVSMLAIFSFAGLFFFFPQYLQLVRGFSPLKAGGIEIAGMLFAAFAVVALPPLVRRYGQGRALGLALGIMACGFIGIALSDTLGHFSAFILALALIGFGAGLAYPAATDILLAAAPPERAGAASSLSQTAYQLGTALGIAVFGSLVSLVYRMRVEVPDNLSDVEEKIRESLASAQSVLDTADPISQQILQSVRSAFAYAMQETSVLAAALLFFALIIAWRKLSD
ncbi:MAG: MFS transporter, partial [Actinomycetaceae bacterium]|nr:MFS transporter [Actinomycetaceae bacterium]